MLFLWSREPVPAAVGATPRAGPWFAWFATAVLIWRCRKRIARAVFGATATLRLLKRKRSGGLSTSVVVSKAHHLHHSKTFKQPSTVLQQQLQGQSRHRRRRQNTLANINGSSEELRRSRHSKHHQSGSGNSMTSSMSIKSGENEKAQGLRRESSLGSKTRLKRLHAGDGPHMNVDRKLAMSASCYRISQQLYCRMTRSGRIYGRYPTKSSVK